MHDTRGEVHRAIQAVAAIGKRLLPPRDDDSQQSFTWSPKHEAFVQGLVEGRFRPAIRLADLTALLIDDGDEIFTRLPLRTESPVDVTELVELAGSYAQAATILEAFREKHPKASPVRLWPHHLDVAILIGSIGIGFLAGDAEIDEPYWYVTNTPMPDPLPPLSVGEWHRGSFTGAVLKGTREATTIEDFLEAAIAALS